MAESGSHPTPSPNSSPRLFPRSAEGRAALDRHQVLHCLYELCSLRSSDLYLKLILSSLDYSASDWGSREVIFIFKTCAR